jgi:hypothetical protein
MIRCIPIAAIALLLTACASNEFDRQRPIQTFQAETVTVPEYQDFLAALDAAVENGNPRELNSVDQ